MHRFYQEQYQLNGGLQNRYVTGSDAVGLTMGHYDTKQLPIYQYLHAAGAPNYVIADHFFQAAFGGSFLNHQYLVAARAPIDTDAGPGGPHAGLHSVVDTNGFPNAGYPLYKPDHARSNDGQLTQACGADADPTRRLRRLRGQHDAAGQPAARRRRRSCRSIDDTTVPEHR